MVLMLEFHKKYVDVHGRDEQLCPGILYEYNEPSEGLAGMVMDLADSEPKETTHRDQYVGPSMEQAIACDGLGEVP